MEVVCSAVSGHSRTFTIPCPFGDGKGSRVSPRRHTIKGGGEEKLRVGGEGPTPGEEGGGNIQHTTRTLYHLFSRDDMDRII